MNPNEIKKAFDILDKFDFFNQRAGRELWSDKPKDIQDKDIQDFSNDVKFLKDFINQLEAEAERLTNKCDDCAGCTQWKCDCTNIESEAIKEFAEKIKSKIYTAHFGSIKRGFNVTTINPSDIDSLVKEMVGDEE